MASFPPPPESSYTEMDTADLDALGRHCEAPFCGQLDFLPFRCDSCKHTYCLDHRSETAHKCTHAGEWARNRRKAQLSTTTTGPMTQKPTLATTSQCSDPKCKTFINTPQSLGVHCSTCNRTYCMKHRFQEDHDCKNLIPLGARPTNALLQNNTEKLRSGFSRLKKWGSRTSEELKPKPKPTSRAAQLVALNTLKKTAKGDEKVPMEKRIYVHVEAEAASTTSKLPRAELYFNNEWSVGRMLDDAARRLQVANHNNMAQSEEERLRVYHVEGGRLMEFSEKLNGGLVNGNTVVLLRGVGPNEA